MEPLIREWFPPPSADTDLHIPDGLTASSILSLKAEHIDAYRTGHAFTYASYEWNCPLHSTQTYLVAYADGIMAWVDTTDSYSVNSLDLRTGHRCSYSPEVRIRVNAIAMSSSMLAAFGSGRCHVWNLGTGDCYRIQLPSNKGQRIVVSGQTLALVARLGPTDQPEATMRFEVVTWTLKDQRTSSFCVALRPKKDRYTYSTEKYMLDKNAESLHFFERVFYLSDGSTHFHYTRTSLDGALLAQDVLEIASTEYYYDCSNDTVSEEANGQAVIWSFSKRQCDWNNGSELMLICYNFRENRLELRTQKVARLRMTDSELISSVFFWKDAAYFVVGTPDVPELRVIDLQDSPCSEAKMGFVVNTPMFIPQVEKQNEPDMFLLGDETFLVSVFTQGFTVWCFDANVQIFNEVIAYKEERKNNMEERLLLKQKERNSALRVHLE